MSEVVNGEVRGREKAAPAAPVQLAQLATRPYYIRKGKKKSRRYSRGTKALQQSMSSGNRMMGRLASAVSDGIKRYTKKADKSARKKKDGMLKDVLENSAKGLSRVVRKTSKAPKDMIKVLFPRAAKRQSRKLLRVFRWR